MIFRIEKKECIWKRIIEAKDRTEAERIANTILNSKHGLIRILEIKEL